MVGNILGKTKAGVKIVSFTNGTDAEIKAMLDAYYADQLTWENMGWALGDTRKIHLNAMQAPNPNSNQTWAAQDITVMIVDHDHTDLAEAINGHTKACITVQTRETMSGTSADTKSEIHINGDSSYDWSFTKWSNSYIRTYLNSTVWGAFPTDFKTAIKTSKHYRHTSYNTSASEVVNDNLFLPSFPEILGTQNYSYYTPTSPVEGTQFAYYAPSRNRRTKYNNNNGSPNTDKVAYWWYGSPCNYYSSDYGYLWLYKLGGSDVMYANGYSGEQLAPAFAM